jgi:hypothetical protein
MQETPWLALVHTVTAPLAAGTLAEDGFMNSMLPALLRGLLASAVVAVVLVTLRRGGPRLAGLLAAVPVTSAPALFWLGHDFGPELAAKAATASLYATGLTAVLALAFGVLAPRLGTARGGLLALLSTAAVAFITSTFDGGLPLAGGFTTLALLAAPRLLPRSHGPAAPGAGLPHELALTVVIAAVLTTAILLLAPLLPARACGLLAALPVIGTVAAVRVQRHSTPAASSAFLRAYISGLTAKAAFLLTLAAAPVPLGLPLAWGLAFAAALGVVLLARAARQRSGGAGSRMAAVVDAENLIVEAAVQPSMHPLIAGLERLRRALPRRHGGRPRRAGCMLTVMLACYALLYLGPPLQQRADPPAPTAQKVTP